MISTDKLIKLATQYAERPFPTSIKAHDIESFIAGHHSRDEEVRLLRDALDNFCNAVTMWTIEDVQKRLFDARIALNATE